MPARSFTVGSAYRYGFNGKENDNGTGEGNLDFGARVFDGRIGRWLSVDPMAHEYRDLSPYNFASNTPLQAYDPDGNLVVYCNGLLFNTSIKHFFKRLFKGYIHTKKLGDDNSFLNGEGIYKKGDLNSHEGYWSGTSDDDNINKELNTKLKDDNNVYANGTNRWYSGKVRYKEGKLAAQTLIQKIESGEIILKEGETIKIVGHSQGAMYAAGLAQGLIDAGYGNRIEQIIYLAPHQPLKINTPEGVVASQYSRKSDNISSRGFIPRLISRSKFGKIKGLAKEAFHILKNIKSFFKGGFRGHSVETYKGEFVNPVKSQSTQSNSSQNASPSNSGGANQSIQPATNGN
jgi:RHS repeat-associated protein